MKELQTNQFTDRDCFQNQFHIHNFGLGYSCPLAFLSVNYIPVAVDKDKDWVGSISANLYY
jgi:hypothetical protein